MAFITENWERYFDDKDEGLGTTYERFILHQYFKNILQKYSIRDVLEVPSFGMTGISGINSMWWSSQGIQVTIVDNNTKRIEKIGKTWQETGLKVDIKMQNDGCKTLAFADKSFDLSWNFAALSSISDIETFFSDLTRITRKVIFVCVPNESNISPLIPSRLVTKRLSDDVAQLRRLPEIMIELGWSVIERGYFDVPPWPDIAMKKEDLLRKLGLRWLAKVLEGKKKEDSSILNYFSGINPDMEKHFLKWSFLENAPMFFKKLWAHHKYFVFVPK